MSTATAVAIVTGGASGIGLAATEYLVNSGYSVAVFDFNAAAGESVVQRFGDAVIFLQGNAASYEDQGKAFTAAWRKWERIDLVYANVGFGDRFDFSKPVDVPGDEPPPRPDLLTVDVSLVSSIWSAYLALHYFRKNPSRPGKLVFTSSSAGLYASSELMLYGAAKAGVIGLARGLAKRMQSNNEPITVNAICPGLVPTPLISTDLKDAMPSEMLTPVSTVMQAFASIVTDSSLNGQILECSGTEVQARPATSYLNAAAEYIATGQYKELIPPGEFTRRAEKRGALLKGMAGLQR